MYFKRFYDEYLAQASYLIGCQAGGVAIVVDPTRVIEPYLETARAEGLTITAVAETHIHADFLSGLRELVARTGAHAFVSGAGPAEWQYAFRSEPNVTALADRDRIPIGNVVLQAVHTPGHTPEHLAFLVTDGAVADEPLGIITGDFVFVGDVGRPDLLEKAAGVSNTARAAAGELYRSLGWFKTLPDHLQIWPGHGAGSACGKGLGAMPQSTVGYERRYNWGLTTEPESAFIAEVLAGQPEPPAYFGRMKRVNRDGPPILGGLPVIPKLDAGQLGAAVDASAIVIDTRPTAGFAAGYVPGTLNLPWGRNFPTYAGSLVPPDRDLYLILAPSSDNPQPVTRALVSIGLDRVVGWFETAALDAWRQSGRRFGSITQMSPRELARLAGNGAFILDVRNRSEWDDGHLTGATLIPLAELVQRLEEVPRDREIVVHCQGGGRASIAASFLKANGRDRVSNLAGGFGAWVSDGGAVER